MYFRAEYIAIKATTTSISNNITVIMRFSLNIVTILRMNPTIKALFTFNYSHLISKLITYDTRIHIFF